MNAIYFWLRVVGWTLATLAEIPLRAARRLLTAQGRVEDARDVFEEDHRD